VIDAYYNIIITIILDIISLQQIASTGAVQMHHSCISIDILYIMWHYITRWVPTYHLCNQICLSIYFCILPIVYRIFWLNSMIIQYMVYIEVDRIKPITYIDMKTQKKFNVLAYWRHWQTHLKIKQISVVRIVYILLLITENSQKLTIYYKEKNGKPRVVCRDDRSTYSYRPYDISTRKHTSAIPQSCRVYIKV